eukprot:m.24714 g.24714  ORF g.24714 m.24714 type:complete len:381 (+) comp8628_c0_seq2:1331-2473(+)
MSLTVKSVLKEAQEQIAQVQLVLQQGEANGSVGALPDFDAASFSPNLASLAQSTKSQTTKLNLLLRTTPLVAEHVQTLLSHVVNTYLALAGYGLAFKPEYGMFMQKYVRRRTVGVLNGFAKFLETAAAGGDMKQTLLPMTGTIFAECDALSAIASATKPFTYTSDHIQQFSDLIADSKAELAEAVEEGGDEDEDVDDVVWSEESKALVDPTMNLLTAASKIVSGLAKFVPKLSVEALPFEAKVTSTAEELSKSCDDLVIALYEPDDLDTLTAAVNAVRIKCVAICTIVKNFCSPTAPDPSCDITQELVASDASAPDAQVPEDGGASDDEDGDEATDVRRVLKAKAKQKSSVPKWVGFLELAANHNHRKFSAVLETLSAAE